VACGAYLLAVLKAGCVDFARSGNDKGAQASSSSELRCVFKWGLRRGLCCLRVRTCMQQLAFLFLVFAGQPRGLWEGAELADPFVS
jgi:hypothetical protein